MDKDFFSDVTLDFLEEQDDLRDVQNDEQFRFLQIQRRLDNMLDQNRKLSGLLKSVQS
ncbi:MAG: hypothetical protein MJ095_08065 [Oscillospiraceae bacterium]|nr:hypothetical protein [Oscillospiraceae bacterium]